MLQDGISKTETINRCMGWVPCQSKTDHGSPLSKHFHQLPGHSERRALVFATSPCSCLLLLLAHALHFSHIVLLAFLHTPGMLLPQGPCTDCSLDRKHSSSGVHMAHFLPSFRSLLMWHLINLSVRLYASSPQKISVPPPDSISPLH